MVCVLKVGEEVYEVKSLEKLKALIREKGVTSTRKWRLRCGNSEEDMKILTYMIDSIQGTIIITNTGWVMPEEALE